jgi:hypothetical protein
MSACVCPVYVAGPSSVWNLNVSTPEGVRVNSKFLNAVKYEGSVTDMWNSSAGRKDVSRHA